MLEPLSSTLLDYVQAKVKECVIPTSPIPIASPMCSILQYPIVAANIASIRNLLNNVTKLSGTHGTSAKRKAIFLNCVMEDVDEDVIELLVQSAWTKLAGVVTRR